MVLYRFVDYLFDREDVFGELGADIAIAIAGTKPGLWLSDGELPSSAYFILSPPYSIYKIIDDLFQDLLGSDPTDPTDGCDCACPCHDDHDSSPPPLPEIPITLSSPIILDLDGDGVETVYLGNGVHFDHDGNGFAEKTGWAGADDAMLVFDRNGNGLVDDGRELFGNNSVLANGQKAANGFGNIPSLHQVDELFTLDALGITALNASASGTNYNSVAA